MKKLEWVAAFASLCIALAPAHAEASERNPAPPMKPRPPACYDEGDPLIDKLWHLERIGVYQAWKTTKGSHSTVIAIVDSGIDYNHPDISPNIIDNPGEIAGNGIDDDRNGYVDDVIGWDYVKSIPLPWDRSGHGTFMAGLAAAAEGNGIGVAGACPRCGILPVRFLNSEGMGSNENAIRGIRYAIKRRVSVINVSFSGEGYDADLEAAIHEADEADILVMAAASNDGADNDKDEIYPANLHLPNLITVAASDFKDRLWKGSNWGKRTVHLAVPGDEVMSIWFGKYDTGSGTSDATAIASGAAALVRSANPKLSARIVKRILLATVRDVPALEGKLITGGVMDVAAAVECATDGLECLK